MSNRLRILQSSFIDDEFQLKNKYAKILYHDYAKHMPIIDYHNHISPKIIAKNNSFDSIYDIWLAGDHYKWRAMRTLRIAEQFITGKATPREKFKKWATAVPYTVSNPLYDCTHLELQRYFNIDELLCGENADSIFEETKRKLQLPYHSPIELLTGQNVEVVCTIDDPINDLQSHKNFSSLETPFKMSMAFRPDMAYAEQGQEEFNAYLTLLEEASFMTIINYDDFCISLEKRIDFFHDHGCRLSDHGLNLVPIVPHEESRIQIVFDKIRGGKQFNKAEVANFQFHILLFLCKSYHATGWVQQFHLGALRNTNSRMFKILGPDTDFDSIQDFQQDESLWYFLNCLDSSDQLTKTFIYNLNLANNAMMSTMIGNLTMVA